MESVAEMTTPKQPSFAARLRRTRSLFCFRQKRNYKIEDSRFVIKIFQILNKSEQKEKRKEKKVSKKRKKNQEDEKAKREIEKMRKKLADSFREFARRHGVADEKVEKFVEEMMELLKKGKEIPTVEERDRAVQEVFKKYGIAVEVE